MIWYNVTVNVDHDIHEEWLSWMQATHIPDVMSKGIFTENRILKVLADEDSGGVTYAIQYACNTMDDYIRYKNEFAPALQKEVIDKYGDKCVAFRTLLETI